MKMKTILGAFVLAAASSADASNADRVRKDFPLAKTSWVHYVVPAMSNVQRLPDAYPVDGTPGGTNRIVMAKGEYEPASILFYAFEDLGKVQLTLGEFKNETGDVFPKERLDLKFVKCWYQNQNAWFSYFGDTGNKLVPELLVNDEDLIRVDTKAEANYARLVGADGTVVEKWLNAPPKTEGRLEVCDGRESFKPMAPNFRDAHTLQPVRFEKDAFKNFFLTVKTTKDTKPGLYKGEIRLHSNIPNSNIRTFGSVPVEIRVLDFELPQPKAYRNPEQDFLVASYGYQYLGKIMELNGGDFELAKRQFKAAMKNLVEHNQTMYWIRGDCNEEVDFTIRTMKEVGMRTDVFIGGVSSGGYYQSPNDANFYRRQAKARREYFDRTYGHHNVYLGFGDEPGAAWVQRERELCFRAFGEQGFKFIIAGWNQIFDKGSMVFDWANVGTQPTVANGVKMADKWNQVGDKLVAWYAGHHVGPENPDFNRRQNGLGAWLNGFSALCNYAHHYGPYNDRTTMYRAMVYGYGVYGGVLDTLAWEGFREGVDDIRYATLMTDLARRAKREGDFDTRRLGTAALTYLAQLEPDKFDQNACRAEMQRWIADLSAALAAGKKPVPAFVEPTDEKEKKRYMKEIVLGQGWDCKAAPQVPLAEQCAAIGREIFFRDGKPVADTNALYGAILQRLNGWPKPYPGDEVAAWLWSRAEAIQPDVATNRLAIPDNSLRNLVGSLVRLGNPAKAEIVVTRAALYNPKLNAENRFKLMTLARLCAAKPQDVPNAWKRVLKEHGEGVPVKVYEPAICAAGVVANTRCESDKVRAIEALRVSLFKPQPKKTYTVRYSPKPVEGAGDWDQLGFKPEKQAMDRAFGGNTDLLYTDVSSGARAAVDKDTKEKLPPPTMEVVTDDWGLHFRFTAPDPKARAVELGLARGGSYEFYLAPGANKPYFCATAEDLNEKGGSFWNTTYATEGHRRVETEDTQYYAMRTRFRDDAIVMTFDIAWTAYAENIPSNGTVWNFENMRWCRTGSYAWNGLNSIHGRSTWGDLRFEMPVAARARILRKQLFRARRIYQAAKGVTGKIGSWNDTLLGDVAFYEQALKPLLAKYDAIADRLDEKTSDADVQRDANEVLAKWLCLEEVVGRLRADWLNFGKGK